MILNRSNTAGGAKARERVGTLTRNNNRALDTWEGVERLKQRIGARMIK